MENLECPVFFLKIKELEKYKDSGQINCQIELLVLSSFKLSSLCILLVINLCCIDT